MYTMIWSMVGVQVIIVAIAAVVVITGTWLELSCNKSAVSVLIPSDR